MKKSVWSYSENLPEFKKLEKDIKTDVLIVGGGLCGILCAYFLKQKGINYVLVEGGKTASGVTKNTTAKITSLHSLIYDKILSKYGFNKAQMYLIANEDAVKEYENICKNIDCDFEKRKAYTYSLRNREKIEREVKAINKIGLDAYFVERCELPFEIKGAVCLENQAQFNPIKFIAEISKDLNIYENTLIREITKNTATSDSGRIKFKKVIVTTHFPFINKHGSYFLKLYQHRSYVSAFSGAQNIKGMYVDEDKKGLSFRCYNDLLLIGGGSHRTGKKGGTWNEINDFASIYYPDANLEYEWATQDTMSLDLIPYIGKYSAMTPNMYVATGFNKWGMTSSMVSAKILCDMIIDKKNKYEDVFSPQRSIIKPQLFVNGLESAVNLMTPSLKRCPHLGCALKWNKHEHTWDCPCHGSRFDENGKLIDNPSTGDAKIK